MATLYTCDANEFTIKVPPHGRRSLAGISSGGEKWYVKGGAPVVHYIAFELVGIRLPDEIGKIESAIKGLGDAYQFQKHAWLVESESSNTEISERIVATLRQNDKLLCMRIHKDWVAANVPQRELDWLSGRNYAGAGDPPLFGR
jgi:hypothetical protein